MIDFVQALIARGVVPNSTWLRSDNSEMYVVMPDDETAIQTLCAEFACSYEEKKSDAPGWIRVVRLPVNGKARVGVDIIYVPFICGQIDRGILKRIG